LRPAKGVIDEAPQTQVDGQQPKYASGIGAAEQLWDSADQLVSDTEKE
jgi:hypothetical protein